MKYLISLLSLLFATSALGGIGGITASDVEVQQIVITDRKEDARLQVEKMRAEAELKEVKARLATEEAKAKAAEAELQHMREEQKRVSSESGSKSWIELADKSKPRVESSGDIPYKVIPPLYTVVPEGGNPPKKDRGALTDDQLKQLRDRFAQHQKDCAPVESNVSSTRVQATSQISPYQRVVVPPHPQVVYMGIPQNFKASRVITRR